MAQEKKHRYDRPTMRAIADRAGVSRATVSLILTGRPEVVGRFKPETVARVRAIAEQMGYQANIMALSLRAPHPSFYGLVLRGPGITDAASWHHQAFEGQFLAGALEASRVLGLYPVLVTQHSPFPEAALQRVRGVLEGGVCGAILRTPHPVLDTHLRRQIERGMPVVVVFPENPSACPSNAIDVDNIAAGRLAARLLIQAGRRRVLLIQDEAAWEAIRMRHEGFLAAWKEAGGEVTVLAVPAGTTSAAAEEWLTEQLRHHRPDGIYTASSLTGLETLNACLAAGLKVPQETAFVGSDAALWRTPGYPAITCVDVSWYKVGELAVRKMVELEHGEESRFANIALPPEVRFGGTCPVVDREGILECRF
mgnify:CR=1 FL=1